MLSDVEICCAALSLLGEEPISSLDDEETAPARLAKMHYEAQRKYLMSAHRWNFAHRVETLSPLSLKPEDNKYEYVFALPTGCLNVRTLSDDRARLFGDCIYSIYSTMKIEYTEDVCKEKTPIWFDIALKFNLAHVFAIPMTGKIELSDYFKGEAKEAFEEALRLDAQQSRPPAFFVGPLGGARA